jgi:hypothetical protein
MLLGHSPTLGIMNSTLLYLPNVGEWWWTGREGRNHHRKKKQSGACASVQLSSTVTQQLGLRASCLLATPHAVSDSKGLPESSRDRPSELSGSSLVGVRGGTHQWFFNHDERLMQLLITSIGAGDVIAAFGPARALTIVLGRWKQQHQAVFIYM